METDQSRIGLTAELAKYVELLDLDSIPNSSQHAAKRTLVNIIGCCVGGAHHQIVEHAIAALLPFGGNHTSVLFGRTGQTDALTASFINALSSSAYSFDDTHSQTILHPTGAVVSSLIAFSGLKAMSGAQFLVALIAGVEVACRISKSVSFAPADGPIGWSQTGIAAGIGAAAAVAKVMDLDSKRISWAIGHAAQQSSGMRVAHGTMSATMIFGNAAQSGLRSALLARHGMEGPDAPLEGKYGFIDLFATRPHSAYLTDAFSSTLEVESLAYKPYPCGVVIHAAVDAALDWHRNKAHQDDPVTAVHLRVSPSALALGFRRHPITALEAKVSLYHWVAVAMLFGRAGLAEGKQNMVDDPRVVHMRDIIQADKDPHFKSESALLTVTRSGKRATVHEIHDCKGSVANPMDDKDLEAKFRGQCTSVLTAKESEHLLNCCWQLERQSDIASFARYTQPRTV